MKTMKTPNAEHPITIAPSTSRVRVVVAGRVVADTRAALTLRESDYPPVHYVPRDDADMTLLEPSDHESYCPYKGEAAYFSYSGWQRASRERRVDVRSAVRCGFGD